MVTKANPYTIQLLHFFLKKWLYLLLQRVEVATPLYCPHRCLEQERFTTYHGCTEFFLSFFSIQGVGLWAYSLHTHILFTFTAPFNEIKDSKIQSSTNKHVFFLLLSIKCLEWLILSTAKCMVNKSNHGAPFRQHS